MSLRLKARHRPEQAAKNNTGVPSRRQSTGWFALFAPTGIEKTFRKRSHQQKITDLHKVETVEDLNVE